MTKDELVDALMEKLYPIPTDRRAQFGGGYAAPGLRYYRWLVGDCDHEENLPYDYEVYMNVHDYVFVDEDD